MIGVWLPNGSDYLAIEFAAASIGAAVLGINTRYGVFELSHLLATSRPKVVVAPARFLDLDFAGRLSEAFAAAREAAADLEPPVVLVAGAEAAVARFDLGAGARPLNLAPSDAPVAYDGDPSAPVNYFTTSGSTGAPKLAGHDQASVTVHAHAAAAAFGMKPGDVVLAVLPFCGVFGFNAAMSALSVGATCLIEPVFEPKAVLASMARFGVTHAFGGDDLMGRLMETWREAPAALPGLRRGGIAEFEGRAAVIGAWARDSFGCELSGLYGSSELFALMSVRPAQPDIAAQVKGGGRPVSDAIRFRIADTETGAILAAGAQGELQVAGYNQLRHYLGNPAAMARALTADGWFRTGDLAVDDGDGGFTYLCRNSDALRLRGFLVEPGEIEQFLMSHPGVDTARVVGVKTEHGDTPIGFVTLLDPTLTAAALLAWCKGPPGGVQDAGADRHPGRLSGHRRRQWRQDQDRRAEADGPGWPPGFRTHGKIPPMSDAVTPFTLAVPQGELDELNRRLDHTRWPDRETVDDWTQGSPLARVQALCDHWRHRYDWRGSRRG